jgi:hypothetical protein
MKQSEFKSLIREEVRKVIMESSVLDKVADLYAYDGIKTSYDNDMIVRYGQSTVNKAVQLAPKIEAYKKKLKSIAAELKKSPEAKVLLAVSNAKAAYGGAHGPTYKMSDILNL